MEYHENNPKSTPDALKGAYALFRSDTDTCRYMQQGNVYSLETRNPIIGTFAYGEQWLSGRVLDARLKGYGFEPHRRHCVVSLSKNINPSLVLV